MQDIICNAHYTPEYVYDYWFNCSGTPLDKGGFDNWDIWRSEEWYESKIYMVKHDISHYDSTSELFEGLKHAR